MHGVAIRIANIASSWRGAPRPSVSSELTGIAQPQNWLTFRFSVDGGAARVGGKVCNVSGVLVAIGAGADGVLSGSSTIAAVDSAYGFRVAVVTLGGGGLGLGPSPD